MVVGLLLRYPALAETGGQQQSNEQTGHAASKPPLPFAPIVEAPSPTFIDADPCPDAKNSHQEDRCISWHAAKAAEDQARWAKWTFLVGCAGTAFILLTLFYTRKSAEAAAVSARAAEDAVRANIEALSQAKAAADLSFRPWLTIEAALDSPIAATHEPDDGSEPDDGLLSGRVDIEFYIRLRCMNVGNTAARNVVYRTAGADFTELEDPGAWFEGVIKDAVGVATRGRLTETYRWREGAGFSDSLAPSEKYISKRWCPVRCSTPPKRPHWRGYQFCVCVVVAYTGINASETTESNAFYTAKIFPIGFPEVPVFQQFIGPNRLPIGPGDVALGPARLAVAT